MALALASACGKERGASPNLDVAEPPATCKVDRECEAGRCDPLRGCVACLFDSDCGADFHCIDRKCQAIEPCQSQAECAEGVCDPSLLECVECLRAEDCSGTAHCVSSRCIPYTACQRESDCPAEQRCDAAAKECVACLSDSDCGEREACKMHVCVARCATDADCPAGSSHCGAGGLCTQCLDNDDCPGVYHCASSGCQLDVCESGTSCTRKQDAVRRCNAVGDGFELEPCGSLASCVVSSNEASCAKLVCKPGEWACNDLANRAELCAVDGAAVARRIDCSATDEVCSDGACTAPICVPGERHCTADGVLVCDDRGATEALEPCAETERCDSESAACVELTCEPGALGCDAETVTRCSADGSTLELTDLDCADTGEACWAGACLPRICQGEFLCVEGASLACVDNGTRLALDHACSFEEGTFCSHESGRCESFACEPGQPLCNDNLATSCTNDGSGPRDVGIDCGAASKVCWDGECLPQVCTEAYSCDNQDLRRCAANGTALVVEKACGEGTVCDAGQGTCRRQKCVPSEPACNGSLATTCDATGLGYEGEASDCAQDSLVCVEGGCLPVICDADAIYCNANEARLCAKSGATFTVLDTCAESEFCRDGEPACLPDECSPGSPFCAGNRLTTCAADGSGPNAGGTDCALTDLVCDLGECRPVICTPSERFCGSGDVLLCNGAGTSAAAFDNCEVRQYCDPSSPGAAECVPDLCVANGPACQGERLATCNGDGSGSLSPGADCSASSRVCDLAGACRTEAIDQLGDDGAAQVVSGYAVHFVLLRSLVARRLVEVEAAVAPSTSEALTWLVYRSSTEHGPYTRLTQVSGSSDSTAGYVASGGLGVSFAAGPYYLVGVGVPGMHQISVPSSADLPQPLSFGQLLGGYALTLEGGEAALPGTIRIGVGEIGAGVGVRVTTGTP